MPVATTGIFLYGGKKIIPVYEKNVWFASNDDIDITY